MSSPTPVNPFLGGDSRIRSLNRARIAALPGVEVEPGIIGKTGWDLVSSQALRQEVAHWAAALNLEKNSPDLLRQFEGCFHQPETSSLARQIAHAYGRKLGFLLLMLKRADPENRAARPEWGEAHWQFWQGITSIIIGGGMLAGRLGDEALPVAQAVLAHHGFAGVSLTRSPYAAHLPLVGLARTVPPEARAMLVFDFGHTAIKRAVARYAQGQVAALHILPPLPTVCDELNATERPFEAVQQQWRRMLAVVEDTWRQVVAGGQTLLGGDVPSPTVGGDTPPPSESKQFPAVGGDALPPGELKQFLAVGGDTPPPGELKQFLAVGGDTPPPSESRQFLGVSLACYLFDGQPSPNDHGCYGSLQVLSPNLAVFIQRQITERLQIEAQVDVLHDGTAAAIAHAGQANSVVLTLGTAIGNGFPPPAEGYRPVASEFQLLQ